MSNGPDDRNNDRRVSEAYRALAHEHAPDHLDRQVLRMAKKEARTPYAAARAWMRPVGWAATIALCLAIVMQVLQLPEGAVRYEDALPAAAPAGESLKKRGPREPGTATASHPQAEAPAVPPGKPSTAGDRNAPPMAGKSARFSAQLVRDDAALPVEPEAAPDSDAAATIEEAPRRERETGTVVSEKADAESLSRFVDGTERAEPLCPAEVRKSAARWYRCIEALRDAVAEDRLARELADFEAAYPDFVPARQADR